MLRIAMLHSTDSSTRGGLQEHIAQLARLLTTRGHRVTIFGPTRSRHSFQFKQRDYGTLLPIPVIPSQFGELNIYLGESEPIHKIITQESFDIFHLHDSIKPFVPFDALGEIRIPKVVTIHSAWRKEGSSLSMINGLFPWLNESFVGHVHGVIYVSPFAKYAWGGLTKNVSHEDVIPNGVDARVFTPRKRIPQTVTIGYMSRFVERKGPLDYLLLLYALKQKGIQIKGLMAGYGQMSASIKKEIIRLQLSNTVQLLGELSGNKRAALYHRSTFFCAPYHDEAFGLTLLEAASCGCPVIGYANEATAELFSNTPYSRALVTHKDISGMADAAIGLLSDREKYNALQQWGYKMSSTYSWEETAMRTE
ncbi:MAG: glycosyltransferase family 4 protein, partial [Patescibacteria group bacterium]